MVSETVTDVDTTVSAWAMGMTVLEREAMAVRSEGLSATGFRVIATALVSGLIATGFASAAHAQVVPAPATFATPGSYIQQGLTDSSVSSVALGDFDGDGDLDLVAAVIREGAVQVFDNDGTGVFADTASQSLATSSDQSSMVTSVAAGDLNGDGDADIVTGNQVSNLMTVLLSDGNGDFEAPTEHYLPAANEVFVVLGDVDGVNGLDVVVGSKGGTSPNEITVFLNSGSGGFPSQANAFGSGGDGIQALALGEMDPTPGLDIVAVNRDSENVVMIPNNGDGTFNEGAMVTKSTGDNALSVAVGDLGNGATDIVVGMYSGVAKVFINDGSGNFANWVATPAATNPAATALADFNLDGVNDLMMAVVPDDVYANGLALGLGEAEFDEPDILPLEFGTPGDPPSQAVGDVNNDGKPDVVTGTGSTEGYVRSLLNTTVADTMPTIAGVALAGSAEVGQQLTAVVGDVEGNPEPSLMYRWLASTTADGTYTAIAGATAATYIATSAEVGKYLKAEVTATNSAGSVAALSPALGKVTKAMQSARNGCVVEPKSLPRQGSRLLAKPNCVTNAGQRVSVVVNARAARGDVRYYRLYCQTAKQAKAGTATAAKNSTRGQYCSRGALKIRTLGKKLKVRISWVAPSDAGHRSFKETRSYLT